MRTRAFSIAVKIVIFNLLFVYCPVNIEAQGFQLTLEQQAARDKIATDSKLEWERTLAQLHITMPVLPPAAEDPTRPKNLLQKPTSANNWYDADDNTYVRTAWGKWSNYDDAKADNFVLTDPFKLKNGAIVKDAKMWWQQRRPELLKEFENEIYGKIPANTPKVIFEVAGVDNTALNGKAIKKTIIGHIDNSKYPAAKPSIDITIYVPANAKGPVPLMIVLGGLQLPGAPANPAFAAGNGPTVIEQVLALGWAIGSVNPANIQADNAAGLKEGIIGLVNEGQARKLDDWGAIRAWCWGLSQAIDYFETDKDINAKQLGIEGHSRYGKAAIVAGAMDQRWAIVYSSCAGDLGTSLEKRDFGGTIDNAAGPTEFHWMAGNFLKYGGHWQDLPVDAHELMALVAPRPLFVTGGTHDLWSDPKGEFEACVAASPVYTLLNKKGIGTNVMPAPDVSLIDGDLAFRDHEGGHSDQPDWPVFLKFSQKYFKVNAPAAKR